MIEPFESELDESTDSRAHNIGKCQKCQYFDVEREEEEASEETLAPCLHPDMEEFELVVSGDSGCNLFEMCEDLDYDDDEDDDESAEQFTSNEP
jgi:hypothetical protein